MRNSLIPHFVIKQNTQKSKNTGVCFSDMVTPDVLKDVCYRITGLYEFTFEYVDKEYKDTFLNGSYNKGRLAIMHYQGIANYISFSEEKIGGRNSSVQSVPTAFNMFYSNPHPRKNLYYYFLNVAGNAETEYQLLIYRLMSTIGFTFLNADNTLKRQINSFVSVDDIMFNRRINAEKNKGNNSTFITKNGFGEVEIYGKTYGANKYETSLMCYALSCLCQSNETVSLYEVLDGDLKELPEACLNVITQMGNIKIIPTDMTLEKRVFEQNNSLRSPRYIYNLSNKLGNKHCALCNCQIPELIQGAHIWPVADIKNVHSISFEEKLNHAISGDNGLWLCENHHKLFDSRIITFNENGELLRANNTERMHLKYIDEITKYLKLPDFVMTEQFSQYLWLRNKAV